MIKRYTFIREAANAVATAAEESARAVLSQHTRIQGREEEITAQLKSEITLRMLNRVQAALNGAEMHGVQFAVQVFRRRQESHVGADLMGALQIDTPTDSVRKVFLAQAKVCRSDTNSWRHPIAICNDPRLKDQARSMLRLTSDSFVFLYTDQKVFVVPALQVALTPGNRVSTDDIYAHEIGRFYEEHFKCFVGDQRLSPPDSATIDLEQLCEELGASHALSIQTKLPVE